MKTEKKDLEKNIVEITFSVDPETFERAVQKSYQKNVKQFNIPGFRRGKAPRKFIEKMYGEGVFYEDAVNIVLPDAYDAAVEELSITPVDRPEIDIKSIGNGEEVVFTAKVTVKPEVEISSYTGIKVQKKAYTVSDAEINAQLTQMQERTARMLPVEDRDTVKDGDITTIDFEGFVDGVAFAGGKGTDFELTIGSGQFIPGFEDQLVGAKVGEETEVNVKFPEQYHSEELQGKDAMFKVTVKAIKVKELPELDDEFAKDVSEFETLEDLKKDIADKMQKDYDARAKGEMESELLEGLCANATIDIPRCMIEQAIDNVIHDFEMRMQSQGLKLEQYLQYTNMTMEDFRKQHEEQATAQLKTSLCLEKVCELEKIEVGDEDVEKEYQKIADMYKMDLEEIKKIVPRESLEKDLKIPKTVDFLMEKAEIIDAPAEKEEKAEKTAPKEKKPAEKKPATTKKSAAKKPAASKTAEEKPAAKKSTAKKEKAESTEAAE